MKSQYLPMKIIHRAMCWIDYNEDDKTFKIYDMSVALQQLTKKCREVLVLFGFGHTYEEISFSLNIEKGTVMSRLSRCRQQLIQVMD